MKEKVFYFTFSFKKQYCVCCGEKLEKEKTTRIVSKDDKDYYSHHKRGTFPRVDVEVNSQQYKCPNCKKRYSQEEQHLLARIQKQENSKILSQQTIRTNFDQAYQKNKRRRRIFNDVVSFILFTVVATVFLSKQDLWESLGGLPSQFLISAGIGACFAVIHHFLRCQKEGNYDEIFLLNHLYTYSKSNKNMILESEKCHCFFCMKTFHASDITEYAEEDTATCPYCKERSVLPDHPDLKIDNEQLEKMRQYWF